MELGSEDSYAIRRAKLYRYVQFAFQDFEPSAKYIL